MEKPKAPERREGDEIDTELYRGGLLIADWTCNEIIVGEVSDAEMLIHALAEWIEYKRQLELWERENSE